MAGKRLIFISSVIYGFVLVGCNENIKQDSKETRQLDTTKSFKIETFWVTPKDSFGNYEEKVSGDTLQLVSCEEYIYSPFGTIKSKSDLKISLLNNFQITDRNDSLGGTLCELQILKLDSNNITLFFDTDRYASKGSYIVKGEILDNRVTFANGIKIGMNIDDFYKMFFVSFPKELQDKYKVVAISSCVDAIMHIYTFKDGSLLSIKFK